MEMYSVECQNELDCIEFIIDMLMSERFSGHGGILEQGVVWAASGEMRHFTLASSNDNT